MKSGIFLLHNYFLVAFLLVCFPDGTSPCDTRWIRLVYMMSCGKKKRESVSVRNESFYENLPDDFDGALKFFLENDPYNPMLDSDEFLTEILEEDEKSFQVKSHVPKLLLAEESYQSHQPSRHTTTEPSPTTSKKSSVLIDRLLGKVKTPNYLGIPGFPPQWDIQEINDDKINENHRREIDRLIEECCKIPPVTTCNGNTFLGACK